MKIGILTFHLGLNHGGFLQAKALQGFLTQRGYDVSIIHYKNARHYKYENLLPWVVPQKPRTWINHFRKWRVFNHDQKLLRKTSFTMKPEKLQKQVFDAVIVGSDIVWSQDLFGFDSVYFGDVNTPRLIAYAPSFGWMASETDLTEIAKEGLKKFHSLMVRDVNAVNILSRNIGREPDLVLDPTLLDFSEPIGLPTEQCKPIILVYAYAMDASWQNAITSYAKERGYNVVMAGYDVRIPGATMLNLGPVKWVELFKTSHAVITNTFHGSIFALMSGHPFVSIWDPKSKDKILSLFGQVACSDRICREPVNLTSLLEKGPDAECYMRLRDLSVASGEKLLHALENDLGANG
jgi:hypothetical protein